MIILIVSEIIELKSNEGHKKHNSSTKRKLQEINIGIILIIVIMIIILKI